MIDWIQHLCELRAELAQQIRVIVKEGVIIYWEFLGAFISHEW
jgi:hypothetical protein